MQFVQKMNLDIKDKEVKQKVDLFKESITKEAEELVKDFFPRKCIELDILLKEDCMQLNMSSIMKPINLPVPDVPSFANHNEAGEGNQSKKRKISPSVEELESTKACCGSKVMVFPNGLVPCNDHILKLVNIVKPDILTLIEKCNTVRMWVTLLIPKIEDGNNFGVSIQEETLSELRQVESETASYLDQISKYFFTRGQIVSKIAKYPHVGDYRQFVSEIDEKQLLSIRLMTAELRNHYSTLHDMIIKNIEKIKKPRNVNIDGMY
uniref:Proteasome activator complex subunit 3-like n=1 Tax=Phallusia mammillata TaxID=59560 RepID=A0A6F9DQE1_9ASCI|nr:proteasome activator complex subunit 3-like [Phallusia mammillata]